MVGVGAAACGGFGIRVGVFDCHLVWIGSPPLVGCFRLAGLTCVRGVTSQSGATRESRTESEQGREKRGATGSQLGALAALHTPSLDKTRLFDSHTQAFTKVLGLLSTSREQSLTGPPLGGLLGELRSERLDALQLFGRGRLVILHPTGSETTVSTSPLRSSRLRARRHPPRHRGEEHLRPVSYREPPKDRSSLTGSKGHGVQGSAASPSSAPSEGQAKALRQVSISRWGGSSSGAEGVSGKIRVSLGERPGGLHLP